MNTEKALIAGGLTIAGALFFSKTLNSISSNSSELPLQTAQTQKINPYDFLLSNQLQNQAALNASVQEQNKLMGIEIQKTLYEAQGQREHDITDFTNALNDAVKRNDKSRQDFIKEINPLLDMEDTTKNAYVLGYDDATDARRPIDAGLDFIGGFELATLSKVLVTKYGSIAAGGAAGLGGALLGSSYIAAQNLPEGRKVRKDVRAWVDVEPWDHPLERTGRAVIAVPTTIASVFADSGDWMAERLGLT